MHDLLLEVLLQRMARELFGLYRVKVEVHMNLSTSNLKMLAIHTQFNHALLVSVRIQVLQSFLQPKPCMDMDPRPWAIYTWTAIYVMYIIMVQGSHIHTYVYTHAPRNQMNMFYIVP